jgi:hypothetical protein
VADIKFELDGITFESEVSNSAPKGGQSGGRSDEADRLLRTDEAAEVLRSGDTGRRCRVLRTGRAGAVQGRGHRDAQHKKLRATVDEQRTVQFLSKPNDSFLKPRPRLESGREDCERQAECVGNRLICDAALVGCYGIGEAGVGRCGGGEAEVRES